MLCSTRLTRCSRPCKVRVTLPASPPFLFVYRDARLAVPGATPNTPGKSLRIGKSPFSAFWRRPKRVISGGRRAVKTCWLSLVARDTPRGMWWLRVVSLAFMICCHWLTCSKRTVLAARSKPVELMKYAAHRIPGLPYHQSWTCVVVMKYCRKPWSELTKSNTQLDAYVISKHWMNCLRRWPMINRESLHCSRLAKRMMPHVCALKPALRVIGVCRCKHINI